MTTVDSIVASLHDALTRSAGRLFVADSDFGASLRIGQILKGRVLRHYEDGRYLMDFAGREKVVDSSVPLRVSQLVTARVVAVGDQVHLQRLQDEGEAVSRLAPPEGRPLPFGRHERMVRELFDRYQAALPSEALETLVLAVRRAPDPALMSLCGLVLAKIGATVTPELLQAVYRRLDAAGLPPAGRAPDPAHRLVADPAKPPDATAALEPLAAGLRSLAAQVGVADAPLPTGDGSPPDAGGFGGDMPGDSRKGDGDAAWLLGHWLLNAQSHPRIASRLVRLPIWLGDRLVEVSLAFFSETGSEGAPGIRFGHAVLCLDLERLGRVQVTVNAAERSLRLAFAAEAEESTALLARHVSPLREVLARLDWQVAEMTFLQMELSQEGAVLDTVVHHHITQDSLSRWM